MMTDKNWKFIEKLDEAFKQGEAEFDSIGRITIGPDVHDEFLDLPKGEWRPNGKKDGLIGKIWDAEIVLDDSLVGKHIILEPKTDEQLRDEENDAEMWDF